MRVIPSRYFCLLLLTIASCANPTAPRVSVAEPLPDPVLIHLPGIGGELSIDHDLVAGLLAGHAAASAEIIDWTGDDGGPRALGNVARHHEQSLRVAQRIEAIHHANPHQPIILVGHSGGTGIAVWALEDLPPDVHVRTLLLLASALSPGYDLTAALRHVDGHAISLYSVHDDVVLGAGTEVFGTIDRIKSPAAGYVGFHAPATGLTPAYQKLIQIPYDPAWANLNNPGDHIGPTDRVFSRAVLAPLLKQDSHARN